MILAVFSLHCSEKKINYTWLYWMFYELIKPPSCPDISKYTQLQKAVTIQAGSAVSVYDRYRIQTSSQNPVSIKIQLKSDCVLYRDFEYCLNGGYGYASSSNSSSSYATSCDDNSVSLRVPIQGGTGVSETCSLSYGAQIYEINIYTLEPKEGCFYEITYN